MLLFLSLVPWPHQRYAAVQLRPKHGSHGEAREADKDKKTERVRKGKVSLWPWLGEMSGGASSPHLDINPPPLFRSLSLCNSEDA